LWCDILRALIVRRRLLIIEIVQLQLKLSFAFASSFYLCTLSSKASLLFLGLTLRSLLAFLFLVLLDFALSDLLL
jgi:hypothetical protein